MLPQPLTDRVPHLQGELDKKALKKTMYHEFRQMERSTPSPYALPLRPVLHLPHRKHQHSPMPELPPCHHGSGALARGGKLGV